MSDNSARIHRRNAEVIPGGVSSSNRALNPPVVFARASGAIITDADGSDFIDYHCAFGPIILGHCHPTVTRCVSQMILEKDLFGIGAMEIEGELARKLAQYVPSAEQVIFCNSGSEATFHAVRLARAVTGRKKLIKFQGCYHGWHDYLAMNVITPFNRIGLFDPLSAGMLAEAADQTLVLPFNNLERFSEVMKEYAGQIAAVILEPIPHNIGAVLPLQEFLLGVRRLTDEHQIVLIFDEVVTGFRHSLGGYQSICGVTPDLSTFAKAIANGYPLAALVGRRYLMERCAPPPAGDVFCAGTYNAHASGIAAGLATVAELEKPGTYERLFAQGEMIRSTLCEIISRLGLPAQVAGFGSVWLIYFLEGEVRSYTDLLRSNISMDLAFRRGVLARGIFSVPIPLKRNHLTTSHTKEHIARTLEVAEDVLKLIAAGQPTASSDALST